MFDRQIFQLSFTVLATMLLLSLGTDISQTNLFAGQTADLWYKFAIFAPIVHHTYVWFMWRSQLQFGLVTRLLGSKALDLYAAGFFVLSIFRILSLIAIAAVDQNSLTIPPVLKIGSVTIIGLLSTYAMYSVIRYFGMKRASGADHFDDKYKSIPFVREGMFRFSSNTMYSYAILFVWIPGILAESKYALIMAFFNNVYVWVHYYCLEKPDINRIYGGAKS